MKAPTAMGLRRIVLRDFVIVRELEIDLTNGFTVLTGETGAGKSILIDALQLVTGARADAGIIREGASRTDVSAEFDCTVSITDWLLRSGFDTQSPLLLRRTVDTQGKSRAWINGSPTTATQLREVGEQLLDIHGQHAWQSLTRADAVRDLLDAFGKISTAKLGQLWNQWRQALAQLEKAQSAQDSLQHERERLLWQIGEVDKLSPLPDEWETLQSDHTRLSHAQALLEAAQTAVAILADDDKSTSNDLAKTIQTLQNQEHIEPKFKEFQEVLASSLAQIDDVIHSLRAYLRHAELDPSRLAQLDERIALWVSLARRYKRSPAEMPALLTGWRDELAQLDAATDLVGLQLNEQQAHAAYLAEAKVVGSARARAAPLLSKAITQAIQGLGMQGGRFEVALEKLPQPQQHGLHEVSFLVAGHAGSTLRPVGKVASGGELSRIALAIAVTTSQLGSAQTLIFDEVDSGVGGAVAETVGRLMKQLGKDRQVLAVTHLPQVAACADQHLVVAKQPLGKGVHSTVTCVTGENRVAEIARMLGGEHLSGTTHAHAREMLQTRT